MMDQSNIVPSSALGLPHRYLFIGGLHRSGTSLAARMATHVVGAGGLENAPVPENEGVYLQGAIPHNARSGVPMEFATDPTQHFTETHTLNTLETRIRLEADWTPWFAAGLDWRVEKSPVNLTRMRLLQQLFPLSQFVVVIRHPEAVAAAVAKWTDRPAPDLIDHWIEAHVRLLTDLRYIHSAVVLRYEDLTNSPDRALAGMCAFLGSDQTRPWKEEVRDRNADYSGSTVMSARQADAASQWGYNAGLICDPEWRMPVRHPLRSIREKASTFLT